MWTLVAEEMGVDPAMLHTNYATPTFNDVFAARFRSTIFKGITKTHSDRRIQTDGNLSKDLPTHVALLLGIPQAVDVDAETAQQSGQAAEEGPDGNANRNSGDPTNVFDPASSTIANILHEPQLPPYDNLFDGIEASNSLQEQAVLVARF